ncbi:S-layer homology domain-containing protein [Paenibacillus polysaccharolyticus]|nr:S-layer homology domain-containing protein [Paenibacillus polysaccharolyticus]
MDTSTQITRSWEPIEGEDGESFTGVFDGNGHSIIGLKIYKPEHDQVGLFTKLDDAVVRNLTIIDADVNGAETVGVLAGKTEDSIINKVDVSGKLFGEYRSGGLIGYSTDSKITASRASVEIVKQGENEDGTFGGLIGRSKRDFIAGNVALGNVTAGTNSDSIGGLVGKAVNSTISRNYASGTVEGNYEVGGLVGELEYDGPASIDNNYATGLIVSNGNGDGAIEELEYSAERIGGLFGRLGLDFSDETGGLVSIYNNYFAGSLSISDDLNDELHVDESSIGAFLGEKNITDVHLEFSNNYYLSNNNPAYEMNQTQYATAKTAAELQLISTFQHWDFNNIWDFQLGVNNNYPVLRPYIELNQAFVGGFPIQGTTTPTKSKITVKLKEAGRVYYAVRVMDFSELSSEETRNEALSNQHVIDVNANEEKSIIIQNLNPDTDYQFFIVADDVQGRLLPHPEQMITKTLAASPITPQSVVAKAGDGKASITWAKEQGVTYSVYMYKGSKAPEDPDAWTDITESMLEDQSVTGLTNGSSYVFAVKATYAQDGSVSEFIASNVIVPQTANTGGGGSQTNPSTPSPSPSSPVSTPQKEIIKVDVASGEQASTIDSLEISRTRGSDGTVKDELGLNQSKAQSVIDQLKKTGSRTAVVLIPDAKDEVSQWDVKLARESAKLFTEQGIELVISNPNVKVTIPATSMKDRTDDVYFRLVPVKKQETRQAIEQRLLANEMITQFAGTKDIQVLGRPMTIETNLQSRPVTLVLPVDSKQLVDVKPAELGVYIEHSNGIKELVHGKVVTLNKDNNQQGIEIIVDQFSTFSVVRVKDWADDTAKAKPYIRGYADGRFQPERFVTRAEMATLITRVQDTSSASMETSFTDVKAGQWAYDSISAATKAGYFKGYTDGSFKPEQGMTRAEIANVLQHLLKGEQAVTSEAMATFTDVKQHWAQEAIARLDAAGVLTGYTDGTFRPEKLVSRAEAVTMINKLIGLQPAATALKSWSDVPDTHWAYQAIQAASIKD